MRTYLYISNLPPNLTHFRYRFVLIVNAIITNIFELVQQLAEQSIKSRISVFLTKTTVKIDTNFIHFYSLVFRSILYQLQHFLYKNTVRLFEQFSITEEYICTLKSTGFPTIIRVDSPDYYPFGMQIPNRNSGANEYRYSFNGKEKDDEVKGNNNHLDFGARAYDNRLGRWFSVDAHDNRYPSLAPYTFVGNMPTYAIDLDGNDIIVLNATTGAMNLGHGAVLIGNEKDGWRLYSKNGAYSGSVEPGASGPSKDEEVNVPFLTLEDFREYNAKGSFGEHHIPNFYDHGFRIVTSTEIDEKMKIAAEEQVWSDYNVLNQSCIDVCSDALDAGGLNPGLNDDLNGLLVATNPSLFRPFEGKNSKGMIFKAPNARYLDIIKHNEGENVDHLIKFSDETLQKFQLDQIYNKHYKTDFLKNGVIVNTEFNLTIQPKVSDNTRIETSHNQQDRSKESSGTSTP